MVRTGVLHRKGTHCVHMCTGVCRSRINFYIRLEATTLLKHTQHIMQVHYIRYSRTVLCKLHVVIPTCKYIQHVTYGCGTSIISVVYVLGFYIITKVVIPIGKVQVLCTRIWMLS